MLAKCGVGNKILWLRGMKKDGPSHPTLYVTCQEAIGMWEACILWDTRWPSIRFCQRAIASHPLRAYQSRLVKHISRRLSTFDLLPESWISMINVLRAWVKYPFKAMSSRGLLPALLLDMGSATQGQLYLFYKWQITSTIIGGRRRPSRTLLGLSARSRRSLKIFKGLASLCIVLSLWQTPHWGPKCHGLLYRTMCPYIADLWHAQPPMKISNSPVFPLPMIDLVKTCLRPAYTTL